MVEKPKPKTPPTALLFVNRDISNFEFEEQGV
jgi:hypothetical protein